MESIFDILYIPMGFIMRFAYNLTNNYLISILLFTLVMEIILTPFAVKQQKNQIKQASLAPKVAAIRKKYAGRNDQATQQKMQQETMELYQKENFNPAGGCGTLLIQFPIIICLYNVVTRPLRYLCNVPTAEINAIMEKLGTSADNVRMDQITVINSIRDRLEEFYDVAPSLKDAVIPNFTVGPFDLSQIPEINFAPFNWLMLIPVLTFAVMILSQYITQHYTYKSPEMEAQNNMSMKIMTWTMPLLSVYIEFQMAAAIGVYWVFRTVISTVQRIIISKIYPLPKFTAEDFKEAERQANMSNKQRKREEKGERKFVRSLHYIDDEEYLARHAEDLNPTVKAEDVPEAGTVTKAGEAPAPIKNDEKSSYKNKK